MDPQDLKVVDRSSSSNHSTVWSFTPRYSLDAGEFSDGGVVRLGLEHVLLIIGSLGDVDAENKERAPPAIGMKPRSTG